MQRRGPTASVSPAPQAAISHCVACWILPTCPIFSPATRALGFECILTFSLPLKSLPPWEGMVELVGSVQATLCSHVLRQAHGTCDVKGQPQRPAPHHTSPRFLSPLLRSQTCHQLSVGRNSFKQFLEQTLI